jgi:hypothetical protein
VQWQDAAKRSRPKPQSPPKRSPDQTERADRSGGDASSADADKAQTASSDPLAELSQQALAREWARRLRLGDQRPMRKGVAAVGLSLAQNTASLNEDLLRGLEPEQRQQLRRFYEVTKQLAGDLLSGTGRLNRRQVVDRIAGMFGQLPLDIQKLDLCKQVDGYGVYTPFEDHRFLAGDAQRLIVYVELDHFQAVKQDEANRYEVSLKQEVVLFNAADGLAVWSHDPVTIEDRSRNKRDDFFTVQMITLPQRLSVGEYRLKVRVTDRQGGSVDETTVPIELVADEALADNGQSDS